MGQWLQSELVKTYLHFVCIYRFKVFVYIHHLKKVTYFHIYCILTVMNKLEEVWTIDSYEMSFSDFFKLLHKLIAHGVQNSCQDWMFCPKYTNHTAKRYSNEQAIFYEIYTWSNISLAKRQDHWLFTQNVFSTIYFIVNISSFSFKRILI